MALSDVACRNAKPCEKAYKISDSGGMYLLVRPNGSRLWQMKYRISGKEKLLSLGIYPEVTLQEAREGRDKARKLLALGQDPSLAKQEQKRLAAVSAANTFEAVALEWHEKNKAKWSENHAGTVLRRLERDIFALKQRTDCVLVWRTNDARNDDLWLYSRLAQKEETGIIL